MTLHLTKLAAGNESVLTILFAIMVVIALVLIVSFSWLNWFYRELRYLNSEIKRNEGREKKRWIKRRRRLWLSIIPFVKYE
ncbi:MAG: hypothetical protein IKL13_04625 [Clostridia bacterium]|nr:hypothetical protein [Clostridia bacterium]